MTSASKIKALKFIAAEEKKWQFGLGQEGEVFGI